jgi:hypothetical protein
MSALATPNSGLPTVLQPLQTLHMVAKPLADFQEHPKILPVRPDNPPVQIGYMRDLIKVAADSSKFSDEKGIVWIKWLGTHKDYDQIDVKEAEHGD